MSVKENENGRSLMTHIMFFPLVFDNLLSDDIARGKKNS